MPACGNRRPSQDLQRAQDKVRQARLALAADQEEPMRRYVFPVARPMPERCPSGEVSPTLTQILEQLQSQNQLLMDLLGAVNALTAAVLCRAKDQR